MKFIHPIQSSAAMRDTMHMVVGITRARATTAASPSRMERFFRRVKKVFKDPPPPYEANDAEDENYQNDGPTCEVLDLLADCNIHETETPSETTEMGVWHSTPLARRHKSKISLTWVLKDNLKSVKPEKIEPIAYQSDVNRRYDNDRYRKCKQRVVGRNEYYNTKFRKTTEELVKPVELSDSSEECSRRRHKHRHRRKKKQRERFGYDIKDLDSFLTQASIDRPGNIPVVLAVPSTLYQTGERRGSPLPLGTVVNAVFKQERWLYAQTPHGAQGYLPYAACMPLPILPQRSSPQKKTPCWESSTDIYPRPCSNLTDREKEQIRGRSRSECRYQRKKSICAEKDFDTLYLKTKSVTNIDSIGSIRRAKQDSVTDIIRRKYESTKRQVLLVVTSDYEGGDNTLSVEKGEVVVLFRGDNVDAEWFYVRKKDGSQGYIPAKIAGNGYI